MTKMKMDEEYGPDRVIEVGTDDEDYEAERDCGSSNDDDTSSNSSGSAARAANNAVVDDVAASDSPRWPQSYRKSMDMYSSMTPPSLSFLTGGNSQGSPYKRSLLPDSSSAQPFLSATSFDKEEVPTSTLPIKFSSISSVKSSLNELPELPKCSYSQSVLNALNVLCGIGILSMPYAVKEGGWWSLTILVVLGIITCYTGILLQRCLESASSLQTYPDIGQAAFGVYGRICIATVLYIELYSSCVEYLIMMCDNLSKLFPNAQMDFAGIHLDSYQFCAIISTLIILPTVWLRDLSLLSYVSAGGVVTLALVVICLFWVGTVDGVGFHHSGTAFNLKDLPVTVGLFGFCYGSHSVFPNVYSSMEEPSRFPSVLKISFFTSGLLYMAVGICGYLMFGNAIESQFTLNMPANLVASKVAAWTVVVAPVTKYALTITPVAFGLEELLPSVHHKSHAVSILVRTLLVISTLVVALLVPYFGSLMALIGSLLVMLVALIFPCACYISLERGRLTKSQVGVCIAIILVGIVCAIVGTYASIADISDQVRTETPPS